MTRRSNFPLLKSGLAAGLGVLVVACSFGAYETIVPTGKLNVPREAALAVSVDGSTLWAVDQFSSDGVYEMRLKVFDGDSGNVLGSSWWSGTWGVRAIAPANEAGHEGVAWVLHENGYRIRWNANLAGYSEIEVPIPTTGPTAATSRLYCDLDQSADGVQFITTVDLVDGSLDSWLYREPSEGVWERVALPTLNGKCGRVSWDGPADDVFVLDDSLDEMLRFDADTLADKGTTDLSAIAGGLRDFAVVGAQAVVAVSTDSGPDQLVIVDPDGMVSDTASIARVEATYVRIEGETARAYWTGMDSSPVKYTAGFWTLDP
ncbi:MAG: hypothetical protein ACRBN8_39345 [Nannocystales bacterium]